MFRYNTKKINSIQVNCANYIPELAFSAFRAKSPSTAVSFALHRNTETTHVTSAGSDLKTGIVHGYRQDCMFIVANLHSKIERYYKNRIIIFDVTIILLRTVAIAFLTMSVVLSSGTFVFLLFRKERLNVIRRRYWRSIDFLNRSSSEWSLKYRSIWNWIKCDYIFYHL